MKHASLSRQSGLSLAETMVGVLVGSIVLIGVLSTVTSLYQLDSDQRLTNLVNQTYLAGVQTARSSVRIKDMVPLNDGSLLNCLAGHGTGCHAHEAAGERQLVASTAAGVTTDNTLNGSFDYAGPCTTNCLVKRTTTYQWVCPSTGGGAYCTGLRINVAAAAVAAPRANGPRMLKTRQGSFVLSARDFQARGSLRLGCAAAGFPSLSGIDYATSNQQDVCGNFSAGPDCGMPMKSFASADNCVAAQARACTLGLKTGGLFELHQTCAPAYAPSAPVVTPGSTGPLGPVGPVLPGGPVTTPPPTQDLWQFAGYSCPDPRGTPGAASTGLPYGAATVSCTGVPTSGALAYSLADHLDGDSMTMAPLRCSPVGATCSLYVVQVGGAGGVMCFRCGN